MVWSLEALSCTFSDSLALSDCALKCCPSYRIMPQADHVRPAMVPAPVEEHTARSLVIWGRGAVEVDQAEALETAAESEVDRNPPQQAVETAETEWPEGQPQRSPHKRQRNKRHAQQPAEQRRQQWWQKKQRSRIEAGLMAVLQRAPPHVVVRMTAAGHVDKMRQTIQGMGHQAAKKHLVVLGQMMDSYEEIGAWATSTPVDSSEASQGVDDSVTEQPSAPGRHAAKNRRRKQQNRQRRLGLEQQY